MLFNALHSDDPRVEVLSKAARNLYSLCGLCQNPDRDLALAAICLLLRHIGTKAADDCLSSLDRSLVKEAGLLSRATSATGDRNSRIESIWALIRSPEFVRPDADDETKRQADLHKLGNSVSSGNL